jgi:heme exporter protein C
MTNEKTSDTRPRKNALVLFIHKLGSPAYFYTFAGRFVPWFWAIFLVLTAIGMYQAFFVVPADYQQGQSFRIMYLHVPAAWMSMLAYMIMAVFAFIALVWRIRIVEILAMSCAPVGAAFTAATLIAGSLWGRPTWGTYWVWDARLTSELVLLFLYLGVIGLYNAIDEPRKAARAACLLALVGAVNLPIIHYSVKWWNTLHQGATIRIGEESSMGTTMLITMLIMAVGFWMYSIAVALSRVRSVILERERNATWVAEAIKAEAR